jgi:hypothetical protein
MIIYTSMPLELVYEGYENFNPQYEEIVHNGVSMVIEPSGAYQGKIVRLLSSNPQDFLNPSHSPGSVIHFRSS